MYLIIKHKPDEYGLTEQPTHRHVEDYKKARSEFARLTKLGHECKLMMDQEYDALYGIKAGEAQGERG